MKLIELERNDGIYTAPIDISVDEWKEMLLNKEVFNEASLKMVIDWYNQPRHEATSIEVMLKNGIPKGENPYNGIVKGLGQRIVKYLNRFEVFDTKHNKKVYYVIPFEGWCENYSPGGAFVWRVRDNLVAALEALELVHEEEACSLPYDADSYKMEISAEGAKISYYSTRYERKIKNRNAAIEIHGTTCEICGFDFEEVYGAVGKGFIEVHHIHPLSEQKQEVEINPETDLICVCANCHRMIHRRQHDTLSPEALKKIVDRRK